ncbi:hypothetical protein [Virgibacillus halodenitrificans]|uniref:Histidine kinase n=1 Tax=Virgibacillus halodenitrificans TaxID=1482 RepID=A0ABR7VKA7_VIRHA|nr:hypothetical protein [Virgibacillus halodenitrificans]MBD1222355.1 hypothetical protein [Virgibacillus halodenitrificans]
MEKAKKKTPFQGSNRELFYVGYILLVSLLSNILPFHVKYAFIPLLVVWAVNIYVHTEHFMKVKLALVIGFILLILLI